VRKFLFLFLLLVCNALFASIFGPEIEGSRDISEIPEANSCSFWDAHSELEQDYIIIGAGIVGLSTAIEVKLQQQEAKVLVFERGTLPVGASSRNAGFTCIGSFTEFLKNVEELGRDEAINQMEERWEGLKTLRSKMGEEAIGFALTGNYELIGSNLVHLLEQLDDVNAMLYPIFGENVFERKDDKIKEFGFSEDHVCAIVLNKFEGQLDSGMLMHALRKKAQDLDITIRYGSKAERPINTPNGLEVNVSSEDRTTTFTAKAVGICINAFTSELVPEIKIKPGRAQILLTEPIPEPLKFNAPTHMGQGFWFFRPMPENRILLGGGRNLDFEGEKTTNLETTPEIMGPLKKILSTIILPGKNPKIERTWSGIMGFSEDHLPRIEEVPGLINVVVGFGCNGMGIARGYRTGEKTAALLIENVARTEKF
jgi:gamma-glutamylputrescine oxidase